MKYQQIIKQYYQSYKDSDKEGLRELLTADFKHISDFATYTDRDKMIEDIWPDVGQTWAEDLKILGSHPEFMVCYKVVGGERPSRRMSEYIRFKGEKITEIEVFMGRELK
jgi:ketosteroid isomerase-like protein